MLLTIYHRYHPTAALPVHQLTYTVQAEHIKFKTSILNRARRRATAWLGRHPPSCINGIVPLFKNNRITPVIPGFRYADVGLKLCDTNPTFVLVRFLRINLYV